MVIVNQKITEVTTMIKPYQFHTICQIFMPVPDSEIEVLAEDIKLHGLKEPIMQIYDQILDGRARYLACKKLDIEPTYLSYGFDGTRVPYVVFLILKNLKTRTLNQTQLILAAERTYRRRIGCLTLGDICRIFKVSQSAINMATVVFEDASIEVQQAVNEGRLSLELASKSLQQAKKIVGITLSVTMTNEEREQVKETQNNILRNNNPELF